MGVSFFSPTPVFSESSEFLAVPHFERSEANLSPMPPIGKLGLLLGTFVVLDGTEQRTGKSWGSEDFLVRSINGKKLDRETHVNTEWSAQLPDKKVSGDDYVLHGYEAGSWGGTPDNLPAGEPGETQSACFFFQPVFVVTSIEKINGVPTTDARPLDPYVRLARLQTDTSTGQMTYKRPVGILGLPLGTFAFIQIHTPRNAPLSESPFEIESVNSAPVPSSRIISIPGFTMPKNATRETLRGFETGGWAGNPPLPRSENPSGTVGQKPFQFFHRFVVTSVVSLAAADKR